MLRKSLASLVALAPLFWTVELRAQTAEAKLAALDKLPAAERQQRLYEAAKGEGEAIVYANMDVSAMKPLTDGFMKRFPGNLNSVLSFSKQGAPLAFAPIQPLFLSPSLVFMSANAPRPYTGALFIDYLLSEEGQRIVVSTNRMPAHTKVKSPEGQLLEGQDVRTPDIFDIGRRYQAIGNRYREIFGGAR